MSFLRFFIGLSSSLAQIEVLSLCFPASPLLNSSSNELEPSSDSRIGSRSFEVLKSPTSSAFRFYSFFLSRAYLTSDLLPQSRKGPFFFSPEVSFVPHFYYFLPAFSILFFFFPVPRIDSAARLPPFQMGFGIRSWWYSFFPISPRIGLFRQAQDASLPQFFLISPLNLVI